MMQMHFKIDICRYKHENIIFIEKCVSPSYSYTFTFLSRILTFFFFIVSRAVTFYIVHHQLILTNAIFFVNSFFNQCQLLRWMTRDLVF